MKDGYHQHVATEGVAGGLCGRQGRPAALRTPVQSEEVHPAPTLRMLGVQRTSEDRLSGGCRASRRLVAHGAGTPTATGLERRRDGWHGGVGVSPVQRRLGIPQRGPRTAPIQVPNRAAGTPNRELSLQNGDTGENVLDNVKSHGRIPAAFHGEERLVARPSDECTGQIRSQGDG